MTARWDETGAATVRPDETGPTRARRHEPGAPGGHPEETGATAVHWDETGAMPVRPEGARWDETGAMPVHPEGATAVRWDGNGAMPVRPEGATDVRRDGTGAMAAGPEESGTGATAVRVDDAGPPRPEGRVYEAATARRADQERLAGLLAQVFGGEPPLGDGVEAVFRRAERIRRRRLRHLLSAGTAAVIVIGTVGYALTSAVLPTTPKRAPGVAAAPVPTPARDAALTVLSGVVGGKDLRVVPRPPARGDGWRQYGVSAANGGTSRGLIEISVYAAPDGICFPVRSDPDVCARPDRSGDVEYVRYTDDEDEDWQVNQTVARRRADGRVIVVMATGERGTGDAEAGRPPLTARETARVALDPEVAAAFGGQERCNGPDPECPVLRVPLPELTGR